MERKEKDLIWKEKTSAKKLVKLISGVYDGIYWMHLKMFTLYALFHKKNAFCQLSPSIA